MTIHITRMTPDRTLAIAAMVGELLDEIMQMIGARAFHFDLDETAARLRQFTVNEKYFVFVAREQGGTADAGFITMHESFSLYAEGVFGTIPELYVRPGYRQKQVGKMLLDAAKSFGLAREWKRFEVTTPPLPQFERTLRFYQREGFAITGGRKLQMPL